MLFGRSDNWNRFLLWIDSVGAYWVCAGREVVLGQPRSTDEPDRPGPDVPIFANLSSRHACIYRDEEQYLIEPLRSVFINNRPLSGLAPLEDGQELRLGEALRMRFRLPHPLSLSARLEFLSAHCTQPSVRGVLLLAGTCVLGPEANCHVVCRDWPEQVVLSYDGKQLQCRGPAGMTVDGRPAKKGRAALANNSRVQAEGISFSVECLDG